MRRAGSLATLTLLAGLLSLAAACSDDDNGGPDPTATASLNGTPAPDIRQEDLTAQPELQAFLDTSNGVVDPERIEYADLTEDGVEEAIVRVGSGGEGSDIGVFVYGYTAQGLSALLQINPESGSLSAEVDGGALTVSEPAYSEGDPLCCPSALHVTTYAWDGTTIAAGDEQTVEGTPSKSKDEY